MLDASKLYKNVNMMDIYADDLDEDEY